MSLLVEEALGTATNAHKKVIAALDHLRVENWVEEWTPVREETESEVERSPDRILRIGITREFDF